MRRNVLVELLFICAVILFLSGTVGTAFAFSNSGDGNQNPVGSGVLEVSDTIENIGTVNTNLITSTLYNQNGIVIWQVTPNMDVNKYYLTDLKFYAMLNKNENKLSILIDCSEESKALRGMIPSLRNEENRALCSNPDPAHYCYKYSSHKTLIYDVLAEVFDELKDKSAIASSASLSSNPTYRCSFADKIYIFGYYLTATEYNCNWHCFHNWPWGSGKDLCNYGKREGKPGCYACEYSDGTVEITFDYSISNPKHYYVYGYNCNDNGEATKYTYNGNLWLHQVNCGSKQDVKYGTTASPAQITLYGHKTWSKNCLMTWMAIDADSVTATGHIHGEGPTTIDRNEEPDVLTSIDLQKVTLNWPLSSTTCGRITNWKTMCQGAYSPGQKVGAEMEFENLMGGGYNFKGVIIIRSPTGDEYTNSEVEWVPSAPNPQGKFAAGDALYVTIPEGASAGNYDMKLELWNDDTDELCDATEWKEGLFTVESGGTPSDLLENPGFESGELDPWYSTEYYDPYDKCDWINIGVDSEARYEGDYGAYIDIRCSLDAWGRIIQEPVEITPGEKLAVEAKVMYKGDLSDGYAELWLVFLDADKKALDHVFKKYYESDFGAEDKWLSALLPATTAPSNAKYVRIMVGLADVKSCRMNIDDVILKYGSAIENHPPTVIRVEPTSDTIAIEPGNTQEFKVKAEDQDEEVHNNLKMIEWFVDDVLMETASADGKSAEVSFSYTFENAGTFSAKATVYDEQMEEDSVTCEVNVGVTGDFAIKVVDVTGETVEGASVMLCKYKTAEYPGTEILVTNSGETDSEGFYFPPHDKIETCDLLVAKKNDWFNSENLQNAGEIPKVIKLPLVYEMLAEDLITVDGLDYKLYVWRSVDSLNPKRNRFFSEVHRRGGADLESGFFGFTKDESVDVEHDTKLIWFSYWSLEDRFVGTPYMELPVRATYDPVVLQIPSSTTIDEKKILQDGAGRLIGLIPRVALVYAFYELISDTFWWEEEMVCYGEYDSGIDMDENKYDTTFEAWSASGSLDDHLKTVVYEETMEFPEVGEYRVVPFIQFTPEILPPKTCIWAKEIRISVFEK